MTATTTSTGDPAPDADAPTVATDASDSEQAGTFDQAKIDALFGFDPLPAVKPKKGLRAMVESDIISHERMPMLEAAFERLVRLFATSMRNITSDAIDVALEQVTSIRFGEFMNRVTLPAMIAVFKVPQWENYGVVTIDTGLIYAVVDALLGGRRGSAPQRVEGRAFTSIETRLVARIIKLALDDFARVFEPIEAISIELERIETSPRFAAIAGPSNITAVATFSVSMEDRGGSFSILLPHATLEPVREKLLQRFMGENPGRDRLWEAHMAHELWRTDVTIDVVLGERQMRLHDVTALAIGQTIRLDRGPDDMLEVHAGGVPLGHGHIGQRRSNIAVRIVTDIAKGFH
ncbi:flagellar motor switch protein FliM [Sphingomonas sp. RIT328]|uniref:flagellar motor switch protein FliM n=1 Tax=Sphingomonas sp. RIT328 TaxID=1470591 RepID=UPI000450ED70|nr:flagellar motor switch protein FliM [Sphingomonas sp. RIT328]EZP48677.1 Flagellar motor switch protein FliM [Sphingomonas sp. RIT328]